MERVQLFHNLVNLAAVDGKFTDEEIGFLASRAERWNISHDEFETALAGLTTGEAQVTVPEDPMKKVTLMKEMLRLMAVDGELDELEKRLCAMASAKMDFTTQEFEEILDSVIAEAK